MLWRIQGADRASGEESTIYVDSPTRESAMKSPKAKAMLIAECVGADDGHKTAAPAASKASLTGKPEYGDIVGGAKAMRLIASLIAGVAWLCLLAAAGLLIVAISRPAGEADTFSLVASAIGSAFSGVLFHAIAAILRSLAGLGMAVRDIARNSFR